MSSYVYMHSNRTLFKGSQPSCAIHGHNFGIQDDVLEIVFVGDHRIQNLRKPARDVVEVSLVERAVEVGQVGCSHRAA